MDNTVVGSPLAKENSYLAVVLLSVSVGFWEIQCEVRGLPTNLSSGCALTSAARSLWQFSAVQTTIAGQC